MIVESALRVWSDDRAWRKALAIRGWLYICAHSISPCRLRPTRVRLGQTGSMRSSTTATASWCAGMVSTSAASPATATTGPTLIDRAPRGVALGVLS